MTVFKCLKMMFISSLPQLHSPVFSSPDHPLKFTDNNYVAIQAQRGLVIYPSSHS